MSAAVKQVTKREDHPGIGLAERDRVMKRPDRSDTSSLTHGIAVETKPGAQRSKVELGEKNHPAAGRAKVAEQAGPVLE